MKTIFTSLLILISLIANSQIIEFKIDRLSKYSHSKNITLHNAIETDSLTYLGSWIVNIKYVFDLDNMTMEFTNTLGDVTMFKIVNVIPTKSYLNVDAESNEGRFNYVLSDNVDGDVSFIIQNFQKENGKSVGHFSNSVKFIIL
jgi:hypothetical protein